MNIVVAGGGPAGCAAAIAATAAGHRVRLFDAGTRALRGDRFEMLPAAGQAVLHSLGAWPAFRALEPAPSVGVASAWGGRELVWDDHVRHPLGGGWIVERRSFDQMLRDRASRSGVEVHERTRVGRLERRDGRWCVAVSGRRGSATCVADFVIDATGRTSAFARRCTTRVRLDGLVAVGAFGPRDGGDAPAHAIVEAVEHGWWFATEGRSGVNAVYFSDRDLLPRDHLTIDGWRRAVRRTDHVRRVLGDGQEFGCLDVRNAHSHRLSASAGPGWAAIGDAAAAWDPLASAGMMNALRQGVAAASTLIGGDPTRHTTRVDAATQAYLLERALMYRTEERWPTSPFWLRRRSGPPAPAAEHDIHHDVGAMTQPG